MTDTFSEHNTSETSLLLVKSGDKLKSQALSLGGNPLDIIEREHNNQTQLCVIVENIADSLPDMVNPALCRHAIMSLQRDIPIHRADEERGLFPLLEKRAYTEDNIQEILACLSTEHASDEAFAYELFESLETLAEGKSVANPNMVGYMLRCFFECYKRHLLWENAIVIPLARKRLEPEDLNILSCKMLQHRQVKS